MHGVIQICWNRSSGFSKNRFFHHNQRCARRTHIFLSTSVDQIKLRKIQLSTENVRRHIANQKRINLREFFHLRSKNRIVGGAMEIIVLWTYFKFFRDVRIVSFFGSCHHIYISNHLRFFDSACCPSSGVGVSCFSVHRKQIERNHQKLKTCATLQI